jgi:hypothetical protein
MIPIILNKGYNNSSGVNFLNCGLAQYTPNEYRQVNNPSTAKYENEENVKYLNKTMNDKVTDDPRLDAQDRAVKRELENKADPNLGTGDFRIDNLEKFPMMLQANVSKTNFKADEMLEKNIFLK